MLMISEHFPFVMINDIKVNCCSLTALPDLIPSIEDVETSITLQDRYMGRMTCAMEEECMATSGFNLKEQYPRGEHIQQLYHIYIRSCPPLTRSSMNYTKHYF